MNGMVLFSEMYALIKHDNRIYNVGPSFLKKNEEKPQK